MTGRYRLREPPPLYLRWEVWWLVGATVALVVVLTFRPL